MGTVKPNELLKLWVREEIPVEMAMGHVLQNLALQQSIIDRIDLTLYQLKSDADSMGTDTPKIHPNKDAPEKL
jgi:hypothetical protein